MTKHKNRSRLLSFRTLALIILVTTVSCNMKSNNAKVVKQYSVMGGIILEVQLYGNPDTLNSAFDTIYQQVHRVDKVCNLYNPKSELSRLNDTAYEKPFICSDLLWNVLMESKRYYELSGGAFDISATPLMKLWGFYRKRKTLPSEIELREAQKLVGLHKVIFDLKAKSVKFTEPGMRLDLGGIAKGYAVNLAATYAKKENVQIGIINLAGNAYCFPKPFPGKKAYTIGVRDPLDKNLICGTVEMLNQSVATSGDYERYVVINGRHYTHIMNPKTGDPIENMLSVTIITPSATVSDALSTTVFIKGAKFAEQYHKDHPDTSFLIIHRNSNSEAESIKIGDAWNMCTLSSQ